MAQGTIKKLISDRGFGFILPEEAQADGRDLFFHRADVPGTGYDALRADERVTFELGNDERKGTPKATLVRSVLNS